jgi:hypothetical protein
MPARSEALQMAKWALDTNAKELDPERDYRVDNCG